MRFEIDSNQGLMKGHLVLVTRAAWGLFPKNKYQVIQLIVIRCIRMYTATLRCRLQSRPRMS